MTKSRVLEKSVIKRRTFLLRWLNETGNEAEQKRIEWLIEETKRITPLIKRSRQMLRLIQPLKVAIARYHGTPTISPRALLDENRLDFTYTSTRFVNSHSEWVAFTAYVELNAEGKLGNLRRCDRESCRRWYLAKFPHQRFCQTECKEKYARSTDEFKAHRRIYMKERYHLLKRVRLKRSSRKERAR